METECGLLSSMPRGAATVSSWFQTTRRRPRPSRGSSRSVGYFYFLRYLCNVSKISPNLPHGSTFILHKTNFSSRIYNLHAWDSEIIQVQYEHCSHIFRFFPQNKQLLWTYDRKQNANFPGFFKALIWLKDVFFPVLDILNEWIIVMNLCIKNVNKSTSSSGREQVQNHHFLGPIF